MSLIAVAFTAGLATHQADRDAGVDGPGFLVSSVRGANDALDATPDSILPVPSGGSDDLAAQELQQFDVDRGAPAVMPASSTPKPTPVPVDPDATPIPPPTTAVGQASQGTTASAPSTRAAAPAAPTSLVWPVPGGAVSQYFHAGHLAVDIAAPYGNQVVAAQAGVVTWSGWRNNGGGYVVSIDHGNGMRTTYNHLGGVYVSVGQYVAAGQLIAPVGCTGICTGPHVHFEVVVNGVIDNPLRYF
ncbi:MAG TPA: M23 family metallopeptidase [Candidatus Angelobacter sp.]|nr:M23 family metallopeptidase [Candidatus Angelobacter sp.]